MKAVNKIFRFVWVLALLIPAGYSCTERIDIETDNNNPRLVITGLITTDTMPHHIYVSRSAQYLGNEVIKYYMDAVVELNGEKLDADSASMSYVTPVYFHGIPGKTYNLDVWIDFDNDGVQEHYSSSAVMPAFVKLDSIFLGSMSVSNPLGPPWMLFVSFQDNVGYDYYGADLTINKWHYSGSLANYFLNEFDPSKEDGRYIEFPVFYLDKKIRIINSDDYFYLKPGDTLTLALNNITKDYYEFVKAAKLEIDGGGNPLFAGPPANVPSNISNGALGVFGAYTVSRKQLYLPETPTFPKE